MDGGLPEDYHHISISSEQCRRLTIYLSSIESVEQKEFFVAEGFRFAAKGTSTSRSPTCADTS